MVTMSSPQPATRRPYENLFSRYTNKTKTPWATLDDVFKGVEPGLYDKIMAGYNSNKPYEEGGFTYKMSVRAEYENPTVFQNITPAAKRPAGQTTINITATEGTIHVPDELVKINAKLDTQTNALKAIMRQLGLDPSV